MIQFICSLFVVFFFFPHWSSHKKKKNPFHYFLITFTSSLACKSPHHSVQNLSPKPDGLPVNVKLIAKEIHKCLKSLNENRPHSLERKPSLFRRVCFKFFQICFFFSFILINCGYWMRPNYFTILNYAGRSMVLTLSQKVCNNFIFSVMIMIIWMTLSNLYSRSHFINYFKWHQMRSNNVFFLYP